MSDSTLAGLDQNQAWHVRQWCSRLALIALLLVVVAGGVSLLGVRTETTTASRAGYLMKLDYPRVARAGLDVTWQLTVTRPAGFEKTLVLALSASQFDIYEHQAFYPEPDSETRTADDLILTFVSPPGDTFKLSFDAYVQPSSQLGRDGSIAVLDEGRKVATLDYSTWLAP
jgi:hypothetical protein